MKELKLIEIIKDTLSEASYIGDDCAFLKDLNVFVTQDTLVEDIHFSLCTTTPYLLGRKAVSVNLSDIASALAKPLYITVSLSLPKFIQEKFVSELYRGINDICNQFNVKVIGGDITGSEKVFISICAIGKKISNYISSRSFAKKNDLVVVTGNFGASAAGFHALSNFLQAEKSLIDSHLNPIARIEEAEILSQTIENNIAVMDCSDGLVDALYKISLNSHHDINIDMEKVPVLTEIKNYSKRNNIDYKNFVKWGGEDYELVLCIDEKTYNRLNKNIFTAIGQVQNKNINPCVLIKDGNKQEVITENIFKQNSFDHFK